MSVSIRISDDTAEELKSVQPDGMSLSKMCDTLLKLTLRKIKTDEENDDSTESFMEMVKKISDNISTDKFSDQTVLRLSRHWVVNFERRTSRLSKPPQNCKLVRKVWS